MKVGERLEIAVIGDEDLVSAMRLAGVGRYHIVEEGPGARDEVRRVLGELLDDPQVGIAAILEDYMAHVEDVVARVREEKRMTPVIIEVPSKRGSKWPDAKAFYKTYIRGFIGFDVEL
jgi:vacuolar-type H+-ATPase subunit F/Vma7